ncbi:MAG: methyltransferase domain-containing protein [Balneolaceae bacterium]|nr:methyltransferase domain-containing protein [Balneolaceae bacterium]
MEQDYSLNQKTEPYRKKLERYYRLHSIIYDWTRWSFLFGREELLYHIPDLPPNSRILEVGCGTGKNLITLEYLFPDARIYGIDLSLEMIRRARAKMQDDGQVKLIHGTYGDPRYQFEPFNLILLSYSLSMLGNRIPAILEQVHGDLVTDGYVAVVDFHSTRHRWFRNWMKKNHVRMDGQLEPLLDTCFIPQVCDIEHAYLGLWDYMIYIGRRRSAPFPASRNRTSPIGHAWQTG